MIVAVVARVVIAATSVNLALPFAFAAGDETYYPLVAQVSGLYWRYSAPKTAAAVVLVADLAAIDLRVLMQLDLDYSHFGLVVVAAPGQNWISV